MLTVSVVRFILFNDTFSGTMYRIEGVMYDEISSMWFDIPEFA